MGVASSTLRNDKTRSPDPVYDANALEHSEDCIIEYLQELETDLQHDIEIDELRLRNTQSGLKEMESDSELDTSKGMHYINILNSVSKSLEIMKTRGIKATSVWSRKQFRIPEPIPTPGDDAQVKKYLNRNLFKEYTRTFFSDRLGQNDGSAGILMCTIDDNTVKLKSWMEGFPKEKLDKLFEFCKDWKNVPCHMNPIYLACRHFAFGVATSLIKDYKFPFPYDGDCLLLMAFAAGTDKNFTYSVKAINGSSEELIEAVQSSDYIKTSGNFGLDFFYASLSHRRPGMFLAYLKKYGMQKATEILELPRAQPPEEQLFEVFAPLFNDPVRHYNLCQLLWEIAGKYACEEKNSGSYFPPQILDAVLRPVVEGLNVIAMNPEVAKDIARIVYHDESPENVEHYLNDYAFLMDVKVSFVEKSLQRGTLVWTSISQDASEHSKGAKMLISRFFTNNFANALFNVWAAGIGVNPERLSKVGEYHHMVFTPERIKFLQLKEVHRISIVATHVRYFAFLNSLATHFRHFPLYTGADINNMTMLMTALFANLSFEQVKKIIDGYYRSSDPKKQRLIDSNEEEISKRPEDITYRLLASMVEPLANNIFVKYGKHCNALHFMVVMEFWSSMRYLALTNKNDFATMANAKSHGSYSALHLACAYRNVDMVKFLIANGAVPKRSDYNTFETLKETWEQPWDATECLHDFLEVIESKRTFEKEKEYPVKLMKILAVRLWWILRSHIEKDGTSSDQIDGIVDEFKRQEKTDKYMNTDDKKRWYGGTVLYISEKMKNVTREQALANDSITVLCSVVGLKALGINTIEAGHVNPDVAFEDAITL